MSITWDNTDKKFVATADGSDGYDWATGYDEDAFFNVAGQTGLTMPVSMPGLKVYRWAARIEISDITYVLWKNSVHLIDVISEMNNKSFIEGLGATSFLGWGEKINGNPQNGIIIEVDDTNYYLKDVMRMAQASLSETKLYNSTIKSLRRQDASGSKYGINLRNLEGEVMNVTIEGFRLGVIFREVNNNIIIDNLQIIDSGEGSWGAFRHQAETSTPTQKIFIFNSPLGIEGNGWSTPNVDFWNTEVYNSTVFSVGTAGSAVGITMRLINGVNPWSPLYIKTDSTPHAIENCYSLKIHSDANAKIYLEDVSGLNALQTYSGSKLNGVVDNSQVLIDVDDGTDFTINEVIKINMEHMKVDSINVNQLTVTRNYSGTTAAAHPDNMWIWKVPDYITLNSSGDISVTQPEGVKDYLIFTRRRWDTVALVLSTFSNHTIRIEKEGFQVYTDELTEYPDAGIVKEIGLTPSLINVDQELVMA